MEYSVKRQTIQAVLDEYGYSDWHIIEPGRLSPLTSDTKCVLINIKEKRKAETTIPDQWLDDPRREHAIGALITYAIQNSSSISDRQLSRKFFFFTPS